MDKCRNEKLGRMIHAYEMDLLDEADRDAVEIHLLECPYCNQEFRELTKTIEMLRHNSDIVTQVAKLDKTDIDVTDVSSSPLKKTFRTLVIAAATVIILMLKPWNIRFESDQPAVASDLRLVVMPFTLLSGEEDTTRITDIVFNLLITDLSESRFIQVVPRHLFKNVQQYHDHSDSEDSADISYIRILEATKARWLLTGGIIQLEPNIVLTAQLIDGSTSSIVASHRVTGEEDATIFTIVDQLSARIRDNLLLPRGLQDEFDPSVADVTTHSAEAYRWYLEGNDFYGKKYMEEAKDCYQRSVEYDSTFAMAHYCLAWQNVPGALEKAVKYSEQTTLKEKLYIQSLQAQKNDDLQTASELLMQLVQRYPDEKIAWMDLAYYTKSDSRYEEAIQYVQKALEVDPLYGDAMNLLAYIYLEMGQFEQALTVANRYVEIEPDTPDSYDTRGEIYASHGMLDEAITNYEQSTELKPDFFNYWSLMRLGQLYVFNEEYEKARSCFRQVVTEADVEMRSLARVCLPVVSLYQGKLKEALGQIDDAIAADRLEAISSVSPYNFARKYYIRSKIIAETGDLSGAVNAMEQALEVYQESELEVADRFIRHHAFALTSAGQDEKSQQILEQLRNRQQDKKTQDTYLIAEGLVSFAEGNFPEVIEYLEKLSDVHQTEFETQYLLARAYIKTERYFDAILKLNQLHTNFNEVHRFFNSIWAVESYYYLALAEEHAGELSSAVEHYEKFIEIWADADESLELVTDAKERLTRLKTNP